MSKAVATIAVCALGAYFGGVDGQLFATVGLLIIWVLA